MTNQERQVSLNHKKWLRSEIECKDMSGNMPWCKYCDYSKDNMCIADEQNRTIFCFCSSSYNRMVRKTQGNR